MACLMIIASGGLLGLKIGLVVALAISVVMGLARLIGVILWAGVAFFSCATIAVVGFNDMWMIRHMGVLASGTLAVSAWLTIALGRPFTQDYSREHTDPALWNSPGFIRTNVVFTSVWATAFPMMQSLPGARW